jgi:hypothetical protein
MQTSYIWIQFQFEGFHQWPDAPEVVGFLRNRHRHLFHVKVTWQVAHNDRHLEFFIQQARAKAVVEQLKQIEQVNLWSCEEWASNLLKQLQAVSVEVSEDGENGAIVCLS